MNKADTMTARDAGELARVIGLSGMEAQEWEVQ